jgi:hypothetical protein
MFILLYQNQFMKALSYFIIFAVLVFLRCSEPAKKNNRILKSDIKILILGNSITRHGPLPAEKWYGDWGMAASSADNDYVHVLIKKIREDIPKSTIDYRAQGIAFWERDFAFDFSTNPETKDILTLPYNPDILIIRLGENVQEEYGKANDYEKALNTLIDKFKTDSTLVLVTGNFWSNEFKDRVQKKVSQNNGYAFVDFSDLDRDTSNKALDTYEGGVGQHPSDKGMLNIATKIFDKIKSEGWL